MVTGRDCAVATSGTAARGAHLLDPFTGRPVTGHASASVVGPSLTYADAYATAAFVMGARSLNWADTVEGYELLLVGRDGALNRSKRWPV